MKAETVEKVRGAMQKLNAGVATLTSSEAWRRYLDVQAKFHAYSFGNCLLILMQRPDATRVAGYVRWQELGHQVRKDEHGILILRPQRAKRPEITVRDGETGEEERRSLGQLYFVPAYVFDVSQTDGEPLPEVVHKLAGEDGDGLRPRLQAYVEGLGYTVEETDLGGMNGRCNSEKRTISLAEGLPPLQACKTLAHEVAHAVLGHTPEDDREQGEVEAESVAYIVMAAHGLSSGDYSFGYVAGWGRGENALATIKEHGKRIAEAARQIIEGVSGEQQVEDAELAAVA